MQYKLKLLQFLPNAPSTFLWSTSDGHSQMIDSFESILFKGSIKSFGKPVNCSRISLNLFSSLPHARADGSHSDNIKSEEDVVLELQPMERKSAKACLLELYEDLLLDELLIQQLVCCLRSIGIGHIRLQNTIPMTLVCCTCTLIH